jgi:hypothetical protein
MANGEPIVECLVALHRAGWSVGDTAFLTGAGGLVRFVFGSLGENLIRAEGATPAAAWRATCDQARALRIKSLQG